MDGLLRGILGPTLLGVNHWVVIVPLVVAGGALLVALDRRGR
jgi:hypothetical protein